ELVRQLRAAVGEPHGKSVHFGATSQDAIDTGLMLRLKPVIAQLETGLAAVIDGLSGLETCLAGRRLMAKTRMQAAIPIMVSDRLQAWLAPLSRHRERLAQRRSLLAVQFGGAAGT